MNEDDVTFGALLAETRARIVGLLDGLDDSIAARPVPACPAWSVKDLAGHLSGTYVDATTGNLEGTGTDRWTAAQVEARKDWKLDDILAEWSRAGEMVEPALDAMAAGGTKGPAMQLIADLTTHEHDLRGALDAPGARDSVAIQVGLRYYIAGLRRNLASKGTPALRVRATDFRDWTAGHSEPVATWSGTTFDLFRTLSGRRTKEQALAMEWDGDPAPFVEHLLAADLFTWPEAEIQGG